MEGRLSTLAPTTLAVNSPRFAVVLVAVTAASLAVIVLFRLVPILLNVPLSLFDVMLLDSKPAFVGLDNYRRMFVDATAWRSVQIGALYTVAVVGASTSLGLLLAAALRRESWWTRLLRVGFLVPSFIPAVVAATLWRWCFEPFDGPINSLLRWFGIDGPAWLHDPAWALVSIAAVGVWSDVGLSMVIFLASLAHVPIELLEAARVDGAGTGGQWRFIVLPLLWPAIVLSVTTGIFRSLDTFAPIYLLTGGGPVGATTTWGFHLFRTGFESQFVGYASAMGVGMTGLLILAAGLMGKVVARSLARVSLA